eukprot:CAMPEP_0184855742 /NCGR_PEP_ID=MMETSP0580-20130426/885_1 /TAXON_ID=1118495 /ORGANISM="Dactyliosolen fragilissimus" /LENGTH=130 /DNA_ID=CAMNT_0027350327 /DNA_START=73 /DNA_END=465 /DNA_ORIENTATION=+
MSFMDKMKKVGRSMVDTGARTMLKTDIIFLEREIRSRKQQFGVEVYDAMEFLEVDNNMTLDEKERKIRLPFDHARKDIAVIQAKIECKKEELSVLEAQALEQNTPENVSLPPSSGNVVISGHPSEMDYDK